MDPRILYKLFPVQMHLNIELQRSRCLYLQSHNGGKEADLGQEIAAVQDMAHGGEQGLQVYRTTPSKIFPVNYAPPPFANNNSTGTTRLAIQQAVTVTRLAKLFFVQSSQCRQDYHDVQKL